MEHLLGRVKELCREHGISICALEKDLGFGKGTIGRWKTASPGIESVVAVAEHFGVSLDWMVLEKSDSPATGNLVVQVDGEEVCGCEFRSMRQLVNLLDTLARDGNIRVMIDKAGSKGSGDGAVV